MVSSTSLTSLGRRRLSILLNSLRLVLISKLSFSKSTRTTVASLSVTSNSKRILGTYSKGVFTEGSVHEGTITELMDKGAVVQLEYGVEGFATPKHLAKEDGSHAKEGEKLAFKVIEFNKDSKRIILSHSRTFEDAQRSEARAERKAPRANKGRQPW